MPRTNVQIVTELKARLDAYLAEPEKHSEAEVQRLIAELDRTRHPEQGDPLARKPPAPVTRPAEAPPRDVGSGDDETSGRPPVD